MTGWKVQRPGENAGPAKNLEQGAIGADHISNWQVSGTNRSSALASLRQGNI
jgi:hypothetical protein